MIATQSVDTRLLLERLRSCRSEEYMETRILARAKVYMRESLYAMYVISLITDCDFGAIKNMRFV